jgi:hypothetical protein
MADKVINVDIRTNTSGVKSLKTELRETLELLQKTNDPKQFEALSEKAAELKDRMVSVNEAVNALTTGSKYEKVTKSFGEMGAGLADLDFDRLVDGSNLFAKSAKAITFKDAIGSVKQMGQSLLTVGKAILTNPLFLIAGVVTLIVIGIVKLMDKLGILKKVFEFVGWVIDEVVQSIKDFLDLIGLTTFAAEDAATKQVAALEKIAAKHDENQVKLEDSFDHQIKLAQIEGKNTVAMEREKQKAIIATQKAKYDALVQAMAIGKAQGILDAEQLKALKDQAVASKKMIHESKQNIQILNAQEKADNKKKNEDVAKQESESYKTRLAAAKQFAADRLAAERSIVDLQLELMQGGIVKEQALNDEKYKRLIEDTAKNEKLKSDEKTRIIELLKQSEFEAEKAINEKYNNELIEANKTLAANRLAAEKQQEEERNAALLEANAQLGAAMQQQAADNLAKDKAIADAKISIEKSVFEGVAALGSIFINDAKKMEAFNKAQALVQIGIDTARAISSLVAASQANVANGVTGGLAGIAQFASGIAMILTNIAKAKQILTSGGKGSVSASSGGGGASAMQSQANINPLNLFGQANQGNNVNSTQSGIMNNITVQAVVSESEVTGTQKKVSKMALAGVL